MSEIKISQEVAAASNDHILVGRARSSIRPAWRRRALTALAAFAAASAAHGAPKARTVYPAARQAQAATPPEAFLNSSVRVDRFPLYFEVSRLVARMHEKQSHPMWERDGESWILRATRYDPFNKKTNHVAYEFAKFSSEEVILMRVSVNDTEYSGRDLLVVAQAAFKDLIGAGVQKPAGTKADCLTRVAKSKADTDAYVADLKRRGKYVVGWLDNGPENRFDRYGNIWETCDGDVNHN